MPRHPEILEACQDHGLVLGRNLIETAGWRLRGGETFTPKGSVNHHTAGARIGDFPSLGLLINGRSDLAGPLSNGGLSRSAKIYLIAAGRANHAGLGSWQGIIGNSNVWGLEVEHYGYADEAVTPAQWDAMYKWHAACMDVCGQSDARTVCQHFEWAPDRKIDFVKALIATQGGTSGFRSKVEQIMGDDMALTTEDIAKVAAAVWSAKVPTTSTDQPAKLVLKDIFHHARVGAAGESDADKQAFATLVAQEVVKNLPPAQGGGGITPEQVEAACEKALLDSGLLGLLPGQ